MSGSSPMPSIRELNAAAGRAMAAGDYHAAKALFNRALQVDRDHTGLWLNLAAACRALSDIDGALAAVEQALRTDPRSFLALLLKGSLREQLGQYKLAAKIYGPAITLAPPPTLLDPATASALSHAQEVYARYTEELAAFMEGELGDLKERGNTVESRRIRSFIDLVAGRRRNFRQEPSEYFYPGLPTIEFYDREEFPWLPTLEAATDLIRGELQEILRDQFRDFVPYINYSDSVPLDQWSPLNRSRRWGALHLYLYGQRVEENCRRCPRTMDIVDTLPQPHMPQRSPAAMFSALQPRTRIPPHNGVANTRLVVHLPLIVPEGCGFRVGNETRAWQEGSAWVFDDTIEHEAWNDSDHPRVILICDIWNPRLNPAEREMITAVIQAMDKFNGAVPDVGL